MLINAVVFYFSPATLITLTYCRPDENLCSWQEINKIQSVVGSAWKFCMLTNLFSFINISTCEKLQNVQLQDSCSKLAAYIQARIEYKLSTLCHTFFLWCGPFLYLSDLRMHSRKLCSDSKTHVRTKTFFFFFFCCPINCADLRGTAPAPLVPASLTSGHTQGSFRIAAPPPEVHRKWRQIVGRLPSEGNTALLLSHFGGVQ